jgi:HTH-type transcriptional regulator/antitoxin HigA
MKKYANDMIPGDVFHPAEIIKDEMEAQNIRQIDLVKISGFNKSFISLLLKGERGITIPFALALEKVLKIPAEFWVRLQKQYEMDKELIALKNRKSAS